MTTRMIEKIPYGVGNWSRGTLATMIVALVVLGVGLFAYSMQLTQGLDVTGLGDIGTGGGAPWGLSIVFVVYFVGVSFAGITVAALIRLLNLEKLRPIARMAEVLTIVSLVLGAMTVITDLGQPGRGIINLLRYARPQSPFFGTFTLVISAYLFASMVYLYLDGRRDAALCAQKPGRLQRFFRLWAAGYRDTTEERERHDRTAWWLALFILPLLVVAHSTLGMVFGLQPGRPGWFSALQAPGFLVLAGVSGTGFLIIIVAALRKALRLEKLLDIGIFRSLCNFLWVLTTAYLYFMVIDFLTVTYSGEGHEAALYTAMVSGHYAPQFWLTVSSFVLAFVLMLGQVVTRRYRISLIVIAAVLANVAAVVKRNLIVVPSQTHGTLLPYLPGNYSPTWDEIAIIIGLFALGVLLYIVFIKVFPIMEVSADGSEAASHIGNTEKNKKDGGMRKQAFLLTLMGGIILAVAGFFLSAPLGPTAGPVYSEPRIQFAPLMFVVGVMTTFIAPVVYELFPDKRKGN